VNNYRANVIIYKEEKQKEKWILNFLSEAMNSKEVHLKAFQLKNPNFLINWLKRLSFNITRLNKLN